MASLDNPHFIKSTAAVELKAANQMVLIWYLDLQSGSDTFIAPQLDSTSGVASLTAGVSVSNSDADVDGQATIAVTGGSLGTKAIVVTSHVKGFKNSLGIDNDL
jgi:hypothetical protein